MKITAAYIDPKKESSGPKPAGKHPRADIDAKLAKNYPGRNLEEMDDHNVPIVPGVPDTPGEAALRRGNKPSIAGGPRKMPPPVKVDKSISRY